MGGKKKRVSFRIHVSTTYKIYKTKWWEGANKEIHFNHFEWKEEKYIQIFEQSGDISSVKL